MCPVIGDGIKNTLTTVFFSSLLLFSINLWSSLLIINHLKMMFPRYERFNNLKKINPNLKTLLAVSGWNLASAPFTKMVATAESHQDFADHSVTFLKSNLFEARNII